MSDDSDQGPRRRRYQNTFDKDDDADLVKENNRLRNQLKKLTIRLDDELEKVAKMKVKNTVNPVHLGSPQSQSLEMQNAYKMIERLQKTVKDFENKESYQISFKRILDLESIIKKKDVEMQEMKLQLKYAKKTIRDKEKHLKDLLQNQAINPNLNEEKEMITKLKERIKILVAQREELKKKEMHKHEKLVVAERKIINMEQQDEEPIGKSQELLQRIRKYKQKYQEAMQRVEKQNIYITKLNSKLTEREELIRKPKTRNFSGNDAEKKKVSRSVDQLPDLNKGKIKPDFLEHIPSPHVPTRILKRY